MKKILFFLLASCAGFSVFLTSCATVPPPVGSSAATIDYTAVKPRSGNFMVKFAANFIPSELQKGERKLLAKPDDQKELIKTGSYYIMYANAFIQHNAQFLPIDRFDEQNAELFRAKSYYLRGRDCSITALDLRYPGFAAAIFSGAEEKISSAVQNLTAGDVDAAYWAGAGWLGAFSIEPLDTKILSNIIGAVAMLERAANLNPSYSNGAIWDVLCAYYAAAPAELGGGMEKALAAHDRVMEITGGTAIGPYVTYASSICVPRLDADGFENALDSALALKPKGGITDKLAALISQERALWLKEHKEDYFLEW